MRVVVGDGATRPQAEPGTWRRVFSLNLQRSSTGSIAGIQLILRWLSFLILNVLSG